MSTFEIVLVIVLGLMILTIVYAVTRRLRGLDDEQMESAGSDGRTMTRKD